MNNNTVIDVNKLNKEFLIKKAKKGFVKNLISLIKPEYLLTKAIKDISFKVKAGERVAFIGPNGAGKSTTIKILSGILYPTKGQANILGYTPWKDRKNLSHEIGTVFGQRSQLWYNLPANDSFSLLAKMYSLDHDDFKKRLKNLSSQFQIIDFINKPVRQLSLGQRMRCEIVASLLHSPKILFLDEPTIGLDVTAKAIIRDLIKSTSTFEKTTILLTSHDTGDIETLCSKVIILNEGEIVFNNTVNKLKSEFLNKKYLALVTKSKKLNLNFKDVTLIEKNPHKTIIEVDLKNKKIEEVVTKIMNNNELLDITIEDPPMDEIIHAIYEQTKKSGES